MEANSSSSASRAVSGRAPRTSDKEKPDDQNKVHTPSGPHRSTRYKEKFQALREKYDQVTATHDEYQRDLDIATARIKKLEAENDLLLDAMNLAAMQQSTLYKFTVTPTHQPSNSRLTTPPDRFPVNPTTNPNPNQRPARFSPHPSHMNGSSNGNANGTLRHRPIEQPHDGPPVEFVAHDVNGRVS